MLVLITMNLIAKFNMLFPMPPSKKSTEAKLKDETCKIVGQESRGNVNLQNRKYLTKNDVEKIKASILSSL